MSKKSFFPVLMCSVFIGFMGSPSFALQSGGVEIGDLETGSVAGQPFNELQVDVVLTARCLGGQKAWFPLLATLDLEGRSGKPVLIKITNNLPLAQGIRFSKDSAFAGPASVNMKWIVPSGDTKYLGISIPDLLTFVTADRKIKFDSHTDTKMLGGYIVLPD